MVSVRVLTEVGNFSLHHCVQTGSGAHPASCPMGTSLRVKRQRREADPSPPSSAEVKNAWSYTSTPPIRLHDVVLSQSTGTTLILQHHYTASQPRKPRLESDFLFGGVDQTVSLVLQFVFGFHSSSWMIII
jgi:hypothetical protein